MALKKTHNRTYPLKEGYTLAQYEPEILDALKKYLMRALKRSSRILLVRLDFHYPKNLVDVYGDNSCFSMFLENYVRRKKELLLGYVWCREQSEAEHCHWHAVFFFDKNKIRYFASPYQETSLWNCMIRKIYSSQNPQLPRWGLVESSPQIKNGMMVKRNDPEMIDEALRIISYLAKKATKDQNPAHVRRWGASNGK